MIRIMPVPLLGLCWLFGCASDFAPDERVRVEFLLAGDSPAEGLLEARMRGSEDRVYLHAGAVLTDADIVRAQAVANSRGAPGVAVTFTKEGAERLAALSAGHVGKLLAIRIDGEVVSAPVLLAEITAGMALIAFDGMTQEEARRIENSLNAGSGARKP